MIFDFPPQKIAEKPSMSKDGAPIVSPEPVSDIQVSLLPKRAAAPMNPHQLDFVVLFESNFGYSKFTYLLKVMTDIYTSS